MTTMTAKLNAQVPLENSHMQPAKAQALNHVLAKESCLFASMMSFRLTNSDEKFLELREYFELQYPKMLNVFETLSKLIKLENQKPMTMSLITQERWENAGNSESILLEMLRIGHELQSSIKHMIAIDALFYAQPNAEEFMVEVVECHEELCGIIERSL